MDNHVGLAVSVGQEIDGPCVSLLISTATGQETYVESGNGLTGSYKK
jgi:hypothetical protein